jgi:hypothetical protein
VASRTIPYVPAPRVRPMVYWDLTMVSLKSENKVYANFMFDKTLLDVHILLIITFRLPVELVEHVGDYISVISKCPAVQSLARYLP